MDKFDHAKLLGAAISQLLEERKLTQQWLAKKIPNRNGEPDATYVNKLVKGKIARPRQNRYHQILKALEITEEELQKRISRLAEQEKAIAQPTQDWGEAPSLPKDFRGRTKELTDLEKWIEDYNRLVAVSGEQGIGKTTLAVKLAERIKDKFNYFIWRSLRNAPPANDLVYDLLKFFYNQQKIDLPETLDDKITLLIDFFRRYKCLLVLDNVEAILQDTDQVYQYREGYKEYGDLVMQLGQKLHKSCVVFLGQELPYSFHWLSTERLPVSFLRLRSLKEEEEREILKDNGCFAESEDDWSKLIDYCLGNPLLFKLIGKDIQERYDGNISQFIEVEWRNSIPHFKDVSDFLEEYFKRLSDLEKTIMYWLAIERKPVGYKELTQNSFLPESEVRFILHVLSEKRALIEEKSPAFTQLPVIIDYVTERLIKQVCKEIITEDIKILNNYSLVKATAEDYIRDQQVRLILKPIIDRLVKELGSNREVEDYLTRILLNYKAECARFPDYLGGNIINLLLYLKPEDKDLSKRTFSNLTICQASLEDVKLRRTDFTNSTFKDSKFSETLTCILSVAFSSDGEKFAISEANGNIRLWSTMNDKEPLTFEKEHSNQVWSIAFSPKEAKLASGGEDGTVRLWKTNTGHCLKTFPLHNGCVNSVAFSPNGELLASGSDDGSIEIWDVRTYQCFKKPLQLGTAIYSVAFSSDGVTLASGGEDGTVRLWNINTGECLRTLYKYEKTVRCVAFSSDGEILASGGEDGTVKLWDINTGECLQILQGGMNQVRTLAFSPNRETLATGSDDRAVRVWNISTGQCRLILPGHTNRLRAVAFSPDGETLLSGGDDRTFRLWDVSIGQCRQVRQGGCTNRIWSVAFSPDGKTLASGSEDKTVRLWDVNTRKILKEFLGHTNRVRLVAFSPDGKILASGSNDRTIRLWDVENTKCFQTFEGHNQRVLSVAFRPPDGKMLASGSRDHTVRLWDISTGKDRILPGHTNQVHSVAFSPNGAILVSSSYDQTIKLWDVSTGKPLNTLLGHTDQILSIAFSPDGKTLASGSHDRTVRLWDVETGKCLHRLTGHEGAVESVTFSRPDGQTVASGSQDEKIRLWNVKTGKECSNSPLRADRVYEGMIIRGVQGLGKATIAMLKDLGAVAD